MIIHKRQAFLWLDTLSSFGGIFDLAYLLFAMIVGIIND
jgi:hypothetical protein